MDSSVQKKGLSTIWNKLSEIANDSKRQMLAFGIVLFINYPLYYIIWISTGSQNFESLPLRLIASALCLPLIFNKYWPKKYLHLLTLYWYITACYCLPFFFMWMLLENHGSTIWLLNSISATFFVLLLFDVVTSLVILTLGASSAFIIFFSIESQFIYHAGMVTLADVIATFAAALVIGGIFSRNKQVIEKIKRRSIQAEANSKAKSEFIANMSHDIRTPITGMLGMIQDQFNATDNIHTQLQQAGPEELEKEALTLLNRLLVTVEEDSQLLMSAADQLLSFCNEILETIRLESGKISEEPESFNLKEIIEHNIELLQPTAHHKKLALSFEIDSDLPTYFHGFRNYLDRSILNLLSNALKFTEHGFVKVKVHSTSNTSFNNGDKVQLCIIVEDSGIGIPKNKFGTIFEHFSRLTPSYQGLYKGAGLGLYTVKHYVEAMNATILVDSELGRGTQFTINLPLTVSDHSDRERTPIRLIKKTKTQVQAQFKSVPKEGLSHPAAASILIVEDNILAAKALQIGLTPFNCICDHAENGLKAVELAKKNNYDLIFMDIGLPDIDGIEVTKRIRASNDPKLNQVPILALTGHANDPEKRKESLDAGMQEVFSKPLPQMKIETILHDYIFKKRQHPEEQIKPASNDPNYVIVDWKGSLELLEDEKMLLDMLSLLVLELTRSREVLAKGYAEHDTVALRQELHRMRGGLSYLSLPQLNQCLATFHTAIKADPQDLQHIGDSYARLQVAFDAILDYIEKDPDSRGLKSNAEFS